MFFRHIALLSVLFIGFTSPAFGSNGFDHRLDNTVPQPPKKHTPVAAYLDPNVQHMDNRQGGEDIANAAEKGLYLGVPTEIPLAWYKQSARMINYRN